MVENDNLRFAKVTLNNGSGAIPALGFGTLIPDPVATKTATKAALEAGFRQLDASERYRNEREVGEAMQEVLKAGKIRREEVFVATKLWNNNHRPERVEPAFEASLKKLQLDYVATCTPFIFLFVVRGRLRDRAFHQKHQEHQRQARNRRHPEDVEESK